MKLQRDFLSSYRILARATVVRWWCLLDAYCALIFAMSIAKESIEFLVGKCTNGVLHLSMW